MAQKRNVKRVASTGRQGTISTYSAERSWMLPAWARQFFVENMSYIAGAAAIILSIFSMFAAVLIFNALPLGFVGLTASENGIGINGAGLSAALILIQFTFVVLAIKPLSARLPKGWNFLAAAVIARTVFYLVKAEYLAAVIFPAVCFYVLLQIRHYYSK